MAASKHTIVALVQDRPGVLARVASMFRRRGFNIESLAVGHSEQPGLSRLTLVVDGATTTVDQVTKQLYKLVDVVKVSDLSQEEVVARELALIKVKATASTRSDIIEIADIFRASIVSVGPDSLIIEATGDEDKLDSLFRLLKGYGVKELARTGRIALSRGPSGPLEVEEEPPRRRRGRATPKTGP